jgi:hypothetical protein
VNKTLRTPKSSALENVELEFQKLDLLNVQSHNPTPQEVRTANKKRNFYRAKFAVSEMPKNTNVAVPK